MMMQKYAAVRENGLTEILRYLKLYESGTALYVVLLVFLFLSVIYESLSALNSAKKLTIQSRIGIFLLEDWLFGSVIISLVFERSLNIVQQLQAANKLIEELEKKNRELEERNEFLEEASAFFAASRRKSGKKNG